VNAYGEATATRPEPLGGASPGGGFLGRLPGYAHYARSQGPSAGARAGFSRATSLVALGHLFVELGLERAASGARGRGKLEKHGAPAREHFAARPRR